MKKNASKRLLAIALALMMLLSLMPAAFASGDVAADVPETDVVPAAPAAESAPAGEPVPTPEAAEPTPTPVVEEPTPTPEAQPTPEADPTPAPAAEAATDPTPTATPEPTPAEEPCTLTTGCTLEAGHEGDCITADAAPVDEPDEVAEAVAAFLEAINAIEIPEDLSTLTPEGIKELRAQIAAVLSMPMVLSEPETPSGTDDVLKKLQDAIEELKKTQGEIDDFLAAHIVYNVELNKWYEALDTAVTDADDSNTLVLLADCETDGFNLNKNLNIVGNGILNTITFTSQGIALWGKALTFTNCNIVMTGIGTTPYTEMWNTMSVCVGTGASLTLNKSTMTMDGSGLASGIHAIFFCGDNKLNLNASTLSIRNYPQDALERDKGDGYYINLSNSSHFTSDNNRSGFTGTFTVTCDNSYIDVINSTGNGSNGSNFDIKNGSVVNFNGNGAHGLSTGVCSITDSQVTANGNGYTGLHAAGEFTATNSTVAVNENGVNTKKGALYLGTIATVTNSTLTVNSNSGTGIYQNGGILSIDEASKVEITKNVTDTSKNNTTGLGGGVYINGTANFPVGVKLYNNHASTAGDDLYSTGTITFGATGADWKLDGMPDCKGAIHDIDGWYDDSENNRWLADTDIAIDRHIVKKNAGTYTGLLALKAAHDVIPVVPVPDVPSLGSDISRSKSATNLNANYESKVTLSLPSAEQQLVTDIVFVLDKSTSAELEEQALNMLTTLKNQIAGTNARVKVGVVIFNKEATSTELLDLSTQYEGIENAITQEISSGTNSHAGLLKGISLLENDTSVPNDRKYLIFVSDGITYIFNEEPTSVAWNCSVDHVVGLWVSPDCYKLKYGTNDPPASWTEHLGKVKAQIDAQDTTYDYPYGSTATSTTPVDAYAAYANSVDKALYYTYEAYSAAAAKYHCYAMPATQNKGDGFVWGPSFMSFLANGQTVDFSGIQNDILYLVDSGSTVVDYIGYTEDYNFDFVKPETMTLKVGDANYDAVTLDDNKYGFKPNDKVDGGYSFVVEYTAGDKMGGEFFTWYIYEPITNFATVQLTYTVQLTNPKTEAGIYGEYDQYGVNNKNSLYTNNSATLYPVDSNGNHGAEVVFNKPTVSYTVEAAPESVVIAVNKVWDDNEDSAGKRPDSVTIKLLANGVDTQKSLVLNKANQWCGSFTGLAPTDNDGEDIVYTVQEVAVANYTSEVSSKETNAYTVTNTYTGIDESATRSIPVYKVWNDSNNANGKRPSSVTIYLYADGKQVSTMYITANGGWVGTFENLPVYNADGKAINYTIRERGVYYYLNSIRQTDDGTGFVVTNSYTTTPSTGDDSNLALWGIVMAVSLVAGAAAVLITVKKRKNDAK